MGSDYLTIKKLYISQNKKGYSQILAQSLLSINRNGRISRSVGRTEGLTGGFIFNMVRLYIRYIYGKLNFIL